MNSFASEIQQLLQRLAKDTNPSLSENDKVLLSLLDVALSNLLTAECGLESVYRVSFQDSGHLLSQQDAGMGPDSPTDLSADFQVKASDLILNFLNILYLDNVKRYLKDRFTKITLVESGYVVNNMKKDERHRETKKRKRGGQKSHERMELVKAHIHELAMAVLNSTPQRLSASPWTLKEVNAAIHDDVINFFKAHPDLPQSKKVLSAPDTPPDITRAITDKLSDLRKEGLLRPFFEPLTPDL
jgi:hypothetical protein